MFKNQTIVITGSARGIGRDIAHTLAAEGANILVSDLELEACNSLAQELNELHGGQSSGLACDVRNSAHVDALAKTAMERFGRLDVWINNAGVRRDTLLLRMSDEDWDQVYNVNVRGAFFGSRAAARIMLKARRGKIINIGSVSGLYGNAGQANYSSSKAALHTLTKSTARELAGRGITANCVAAGIVFNDFNSDLPDKIKDELQKNIPLTSKSGPSMDVARAVRFLASPDADYITGETLRVDGGMMI